MLVGVLKKVIATRYVLPLREGGSLPGLVEADDLGTYVVKFIGAGQGRKTLVAEVVTGELGRVLGLPVPELAEVEFDAVIARSEPDQEVQELLRSSGGLNLGMDFLPGALGFDPLGFDIGSDLAGRILWFDALTGNVDRSWRNPNMLLWHGKLYLIDHGASLIFHHSWANADRFVTRPYAAEDHALIDSSPDLKAADAALAPLVTEERLRGVVAMVPDEWLVDEPGFASADEVREAYVRHLLARVADRRWLPEVAQ
ncbi:HipA family kinase [Nocardiopsis salina]|uniref:HipA family kinase n=1 Tax=Nocardiopsis salina TaxID=245836 RepID=UPI000348D559|nr:HipA family kinase [Nocardiopsis salina]